MLGAHAPCDTGGRVERMKERRNRKTRRPSRGASASGKDYERTWGTAIGQDCINLNETLARWLGERLVFLADHTTTVKPDAEEPWSDSLRRNGKALLVYAGKANPTAADDGLGEAKRALEWVAKNLQSLWD